jgi:hypothetical protein
MPTTASPATPVAVTPPGTGTTNDPNLRELAQYTHGLSQGQTGVDAPLGVQSSPDKQPTGPSIDMTKPLDVRAVTSHIKNPNLNDQQRTQVATDLTTKLRNENPQYYEGFQDIQAGRTDTEAAKAYQGRLTQAQDEFIQQQVQADPQKAATPGGFGEIVNNAMSTFQNMPMPLQAMVGIGLPVGLIGIMSGMFGEGGMGAGILGALGLGAGLMGGAMGGMFGQDAQNFTTDKMIDAGQFFGAIPSEKQDLSFLTAKDPIAALKAQGGGKGLSPAAIKAQLAAAQAKKQQLAMFMKLPEHIRRRVLQRVGSGIDDSNVDTALQNAAMIHNQLGDQNSELGRTEQRAQGIVDNPWTGYPAAIAGTLKDKWDKYWKGASDVNINKLIEKWAFNDMDAKELNDLKAEEAKGAPYRVESARRENKLQMRQEAAVPQKEVVIAACQKAARCWSGYEPVPGAKKFSKGSCRPKGSKKTQKEMKKS